MSELKPCPCCGSTARPVGSRSGINPHWKLCRVICDRCGLTTANHLTPEEAAAAWNRRAPAPSPASGESALGTAHHVLRPATARERDDQIRFALIEHALHRGYLAQRALDGGGIVKFNEMAERHARALKALASLRAEVERLRTEHARLVAVINDDGSLETIDDIVSIAEDAMHAYNVQNKLIEENVRLRTALAEKEKKQ